MSKKYEAILRDKSEIKNMKIGKDIILHFINGEEYRGLFYGVDDSEIILKSQKTGYKIGLPIDRLKLFLEVI